MSRSRRKTPIMAITTASSEKYDKQLFHRAYRHECKTRIGKRNFEFPHENSYFDPWGAAKDGKGYFNKSETMKFLGKEWTEELYERCMRK